MKKLISILLIAIMIITCAIPTQSVAAKTKVKLNNTAVSLFTGKSFQLKLKGSGKKVTWKSSKKAVATVTSKGKVKGKKKGTAYIYATYKAKKYRCKVSVKQPVTKISFSSRNKTLIEGKSFALKASVLPANANNKGIQWKSSKTSVATVSSKGTVKAIKKGTATITGKAKDGSGKYSTCKITVQQNPDLVGQITLNKTSLVKKIGETEQLTAKVSPSTALNQKLTWTSSNKAVVSVSSDGEIKAVKPGTATITCKAQDKSGTSVTCKVEVKEPDVFATDLELKEDMVSISEGSQKTITPVFSPSNVTNKSVSYSSSNTKVVKIASDGKLEGIAVGTAEITCTTKDGTNLSATCQVEVTKCIVPVSKITLNKSEASLKYAQTVALTATVAPAGADNKEVTWSTSNKSIATVSAKGVVTGTGNGTAKITCKAQDGSGVSASCTVTVTKPTFTVTPTTTPYNNKFMDESSYNSGTKQWYMLKSYTEELEKSNGGTLILTKGTYKITNSIYVPSNTTIKFNDGVIIEKSVDTKGAVTAAASIFQVVPPSVVSSGKKVTKYNGSHDVTFIGYGNAKFDMKKLNKNADTGGMGIVIGHAKNIKIQNLDFYNMADIGHFIELNSVQNATITGCYFEGNVSENAPKNKEAINVDSTDANTKGFNHTWSSHDRTCVDGALIENCKFKNLRAAIGTHKYSATDRGEQLYHKNVTIRNNYFYNLGNKEKAGSAIRMMNWKNTVVEKNRFENCRYYVIRGYGMYPKLTIKNNTITYDNANKDQRALLFKPGQNTDSGSSYPVSENIKLEQQDYLTNTTNGSQKVYIYYYDKNNTLQLKKETLK